MSVGFHLTVRWILPTKRRSRNCCILSLCITLVLCSTTLQTLTEPTRWWLLPSVASKTTCRTRCSNREGALRNSSPHHTPLHCIIIMLCKAVCSSLTTSLPITWLKDLTRSTADRVLSGACHSPHPHRVRRV